MFAEHFMFFCNDFDKFNNTGTRIIKAIYHMTLKLFLIMFLRESAKMLPYTPLHNS